MNRDTDFEPLLRAMVRMAVGLDAPLPSTERAEFYLESLADFSLEQVLNALRQCARTSPHYPKPADIVQAIVNAEDGHPATNVAWAHAQAFADESATITWTQEMADAYAASRPLIAAGDMVAARLAFKEAYERAVADSRLAGRAPEFRPSLGFNGAARWEALATAGANGLLTRGTPIAAQLAGSRPTGAAPKTLLALEQSPDAPQEAREALAKLRETIAGRVALSESADAAAKRATEQANAETAKRVASGAADLLEGLLKRKAERGELPPEPEVGQRALLVDQTPAHREAA